MTTKKKTAKKKAKKSVEKKARKMTSGDHTEKAEEAKVLKRALVEGKDAVVLINIFSPDNEPREFKIRIPKIIHSASPSHREPGYIAGILLGALRGKYGSRVS